MVHLLIIKLNSKEIDGVPVTGTPVISRTVDLSINNIYKFVLFDTVLREDLSSQFIYAQTAR